MQDSFMDAFFESLTKFKLAENQQFNNVFDTLGTTENTINIFIPPFLPAQGLHG